jgi:thiol:disulfide interchange protein DsbA
MEPTRRRTVIALALAALGAAPFARAQQAGVNYTVLKPEQPVATPGKIEVIEFFWYGCPHCYNFEPLLEQWERKLPADVQFRPVPAVFNARWGQDAQLFFALDAMGLIPKLHRALYDAIHRDRLHTDDAKALKAWLLKQGVDTKRFGEVLNSFGVLSKLRQAERLTVAYRIDGTPAMAVQGRYTVSPEQAGSLRGMLSVVDYLVAQTRKSLAAAR